MPLVAYTYIWFSNWFLTLLCNFFTNSDLHTPSLCIKEVLVGRELGPKVMRILKLAKYMLKAQVEKDEGPSGEGQSPRVEKDEGSSGEG